jgi:4-hydroxy-3-methylbut-2-enyl diphosphate reductase
MISKIEAGQHDVHSSAFLATPSLRLPNSRRTCSRITPVMTASPIDKRQERRRIVSSENFNRRGFKEAEEEVQGMMAEEFTSELVKELRNNNFVLERNNVVIKLAKSYGFCWGVDRAVALAYEARKFYKDDKIHITNEIIHNPSVNNRLREMDINFVGLKDGAKDFSNVQKGDVVILPAFGASLPEMQVSNEILHLVTSGTRG